MRRTGSSDAAARLAGLSFLAGCPLPNSFNDRSGSATACRCARKQTHTGMAAIGDRQRQGSAKSCHPTKLPKLVIQSSDCSEAAVQPCIQRDARPCSRAGWASARAHRMTSSARKRTDCGMVIPSALAVFKLTRSLRVARCSTGRSLGCAPFSSLSTKYAAR
jgi:hypothetical protein